MITASEKLIIVSLWTGHLLLNLEEEVVFYEVFIYLIASVSIIHHWMIGIVEYLQ